MQAKAVDLSWGYKEISKNRAPLTEQEKVAILWNYMAIISDSDLVSEYAKIFHPEKEDYYICPDDESSSDGESSNDEPTDDGDQETGTDGGFYTVFFGGSPGNLPLVC